MERATGFEPATSTLARLRATNCAKPASQVILYGTRCAIARTFFQNWKFFLAPAWAHVLGSYGGMEGTALQVNLNRYNRDSAMVAARRLSVFVGGYDKGVPLLASRLCSVALCGIVRRIEHGVDLEESMSGMLADRGVYLDFAAATPVAPEVLEAMAPYWSELFYNPSAPYAPARSVHAQMERARASLAHVIGARPGTITITAGATEANNLALAALDGPVVVSATEHESVLACAEARDARVVGVREDGSVNVGELERLLTDDVELVSVGLANGELGTIQPIRQIARLVQDARMSRLERGVKTPLLFHTDASQAAGHVSVNVSSLEVDLMTVSAAKVYGPKQVGMLWHADGVALHPLVRGGGQEAGVRSGTQNVAGMVGFACALELAESLRVAEGRRLERLSSRLRKAIVAGIPDAVFSGPTRATRRLPGIVHVSFAGVQARRLVIALERRGVYVGTGSACAASRMQTSHVLRAIGMSDELAQGSLRLSLGRSTTEDHVAYAAQTIIECVRAERARMGLGGT